MSPGEPAARKQHRAKKVWMAKAETFLLVLLFALKDQSIKIALHLLHSIEEIRSCLFIPAFTAAFSCLCCKCCLGCFRKGLNPSWMLVTLLQMEQRSITSG